MELSEEWVENADSGTACLTQFADPQLFAILYLGACRRIPSSARERAIFSPGKDGEAGDVGSIVDTAGCSQAEKGPLEARSNSPTGS